MKKWLVCTVWVVVLAAVLLGCGVKGSTGSSQKVTGSGDLAQIRNWGLPDIAGEVAYIIGNEVTLKIIEMPQFSTETGNANGQRQRGNAGGGMRIPGGGPGQMPGGGLGAALGQRPGQIPGGAVAGQGGRATVKYTGETKTLLIPPGIPIMTFSVGGRGIESKQIDFTDIESGDILQIWYSKEDPEAIARIMVRPVGE